MTETLRDLFEGLLADEPPPAVTVEAIVGAGRRARRRHRVRRAGLTALAVAAVVVVAAGLASPRPWATDSGPERLDTGPAATPPTAPAPAATAPPAAPPMTSATPATPATAPATPATPATTPTTAAPPAGDLLEDPSFEAGSPTWDDFGPATELATSATARTGARALAVTTSATERVVAGATNDPVVVRTEAGARYTATCWMRSAEPVDGRVQVQEYTAAWARAGGPTPSAPVALDDPTRWYAVSVTHTATESGLLLPLTAFSTDLRPGGAPLLVDDCSLTPFP